MQHLNALFVERLAAELHTVWQGQLIKSCFSLSKDDWFLCAGNCCFHIKWVNQQPYFLFPGIHTLPKSNRLAFIKEPYRVISVNHLPFDRIIKIKLEEELSIQINLFGKQSDILLLNKDVVINSFRKVKLSGEKFPDKPLFTPDNTQVLSTAEFKKSASAFLVDDFWFNQLKLSTPLTQSGYIQTIKEYLKGGLILLQGDNIKLGFEPSSDKHFFETLSEYSRQSVRQIFQLKTETENKKREDEVRNRLERKKQQLLLAIEQIKNAVSKKEKADILMAHIHEIEKGASYVNLPAFYSGNTIKIALKPELNAQQNAEWYYKKAKNEHLHIQKLEQNLKETEEKLKHGILLHPDERKKADKQHVPFYEFELDGYRISAGKNAASNDLLLKSAHKNDLWFHASGTSGSHVIIRCGKKQGNVPESTILKAAAIAAYNSKLGSSAVVPVYYTFCKYVNKPKGAKPGQVNIRFEKLIMAEPKLP